MVAGLGMFVVGFENLPAGPSGLEGPAGSLDLAIPPGAVGAHRDVVGPDIGEDFNHSSTMGVDPFDPDYPPADRYPGFLEEFGPRNVMHSWAIDKDDETIDPRWGEIGKQKIEDTGPLTIDRIKKFDQETLDASVDFMER